MQISSLTEWEFWNSKADLEVSDDYLRLDVGYICAAASQKMKRADIVAERGVLPKAGEQ
jgi:hypothetical protein